MFGIEESIKVSKEAEKAAQGKPSSLEGSVYEAVKLINTWADYVKQNTKTVIPKSRPSGQPGDDMERFRRSSRVEQTMWFENTRPILVHVHILFHPLDSYVLRKPGQFLRDALLYHALDYTWMKDSTLAARYVYGRFVLELANEWESNPLVELPYVPSSEIELVTDNEIRQFESLRDSYKERAA